jgi:hypothetical protein
MSPCGPKRTPVWRSMMSALERQSGRYLLSLSLSACDPKLFPRVDGNGTEIPLPNVIHFTLGRRL